MEALYRFFNGCAASLAALFAPLAPLVWCVTLFIAVDFVTGVAASRVSARRAGRRWRFESREAWRTVQKLGFVIIALGMACMIDSVTAGLFAPDLTRLFGGFVCGVELWSFLENACRISDAPALRWLSRLVGGRIRKGAGDE